jgi:antitoxin MazE
MKVAKWGNSLALRLPMAVVKEMGLEVGDDLNVVRISGEKEIGVVRNDWRKQAIERLRALQIDFPEDYKFDREEANAR